MTDNYGYTHIQVSEYYKNLRSPILCIVLNNGHKILNANKNDNGEL